MKLFELLVFHPSITFGIISAEILPWALLYWAFVVRRISVYVLLMSLILVGSSLSVLLSGEMFEILRSLGAYFNVILIYFYILYLKKKSPLETWIKPLFVFYIFLGLIQFSGLFSSFDYLIKLLVPRASMASLADIDRGVTLIASEPARAAVHFIFLFMFLSSVKRVSFIWYAIYFVFLVLVLKSATGVFIFLMYWFFRVLEKRAIELALSSLILVGGSFLIYMNPDFAGGRIASLLNLIKSSSAEDAFFIISQSSGHRIVSWYLSIYAGISFPLGGGVGNWREISEYAVISSGIDYDAYRFFEKSLEENGRYEFRFSGFMSNLFADIGYLLFPLFLFMFLKVHRRLKGCLSISDLPFVSVFFVYVFLIGSVGDPVPWIISALFFNKRYRQSRLK